MIVDAGKDSDWLGLVFSPSSLIGNRYLLPEVYLCQHEVGY